MFGLVLAWALSAGVACAQEAPVESEADLQFEFAEKLFRIKAYKAAAAEYARFLRDYGPDPRREEVRYRLAVSHFKLGGEKDYERALGELVTLRKEFPNGKFIQDCLLRSGQVRYALGDARGALADLSELAKTNVRADVAVPMHHFLGRIWYDLGEFGEAVKHLTRVAEAPAETELRPYSLMVLADAHLKANELRRSASALETLLKDYPDLPTRDETWLRLGDLRLALREFAEAQAAYSKVGAAGEFRERAVVGGGRALLGLGKYDDAVRTCTELLAGLGSAPAARAAGVAEQCHYVIGLAHFSGGRYAEAAEAFAKVLLLVQQTGLAEDAGYKLCWCYYQLGEKSAKKLVESGVGFSRLFPASKWTAEVVFLTGEGHLRLGDYENALVQYKRVTEKDANYADALYRIAYAYHREEKQEEAARAYDLFTGKFPKHEKRAAALAGSGAAHQALGRHKEALERYDACLAAAPEGADAEEVRFQRGACLARMSRFEEMGTAFGEYVQKHPRGKYVGAAFYWLGRHHRVRADALVEKEDVAGARQEYELAVRAFRSAVSAGGASRDEASLSAAECSYNLGKAEAERAAALTSRAKGVAEPQATEMRREGAKLEADAAASFREAAKGFLELIDAESAVLRQESVYFWTAAHLRERNDARSGVRVLEALLKRFKESKQADEALYRLAVLSGEVSPPDYAAAVRWCDELLTKHAGGRFAFQARFAKAEALWGQQKPAEAEALYAEVAQRTEGYFRVASLVRLGHISLGKKEYAAAARYFAEVGLLYEDKALTAEALYFAGKANVLRGEAGEALRFWQDLLTRYADSRWTAEMKKELGPLGFTIGPGGSIRKP